MHSIVLFMFLFRFYYPYVSPVFIRNLQKNSALSRQVLNCHSTLVLNGIDNNLYGSMTVGLERSVIVNGVVKVRSY